MNDPITYQELYYGWKGDVRELKRDLRQLDTIRYKMREQFRLDTEAELADVLDGINLLRSSKLV